MKKITLLLTLLTVSLGFSQTDLLEGFEGTAPTVTWADDNGNASATVSSAQAQTGVNSLELITTNMGESWQGAKLLMQDNKIDMRDATTGAGTNKKVFVDIYSMPAADFLVKLSNSDSDPGGTDPALESKTAVSHPGGGWVNLECDFTIPADTGQPGYNPPTDQFSSIVFFPLFNKGTDGWNPAAVTTTYVDNVTSWAGDVVGPPAETCSDGIMNQDETGIDCGGVCSPCAVPPTTAAPTPPNRAAADVISLFSDAYTDITIDTFDTSWCPATTTSVMVAGNETKEVTGLGCEGVEFINARFDATSFTHFHIDIWTTSDTMDKSWNMKFSNWAGGAAEANAIEFSTTNASSPVLPNPNPGTWISLDMPLTSWTPGAREDLTQFIITSDLGTVYYDNLYLHKNTILGVEDFNKVSFKVFPNPTQDSWRVKAQNAQIETIKVFDILGKNVLSLKPNKTETVIDGSSLKAGLYFAQIKTEAGVSSMKLIKN